MTRIGLAWLLSLSLVQAASPADLDTYVSCGRVSRRGDCLVFTSYPDVTEFVIPDSIHIPDPEFVQVRGRYSIDDWVVCRYRVLRLRDVQVESCTPESLGCGTIGMGSFDYHHGCYVWDSLTGETRYVIDLDGFAVGDTVLATGIPDRIAYPVSGNCGLILLDPHLYPCSPLNPVRTITWGRIKSTYRGAP
jgi:hypothetical protein